MEGECLHLQKVVEQQQNKISDLEREKKELANDVAAARTTVSVVFTNICIDNVLYKVIQ